MDYKISTQTFIIYTDLGELDLITIYDSTEINSVIEGIKSRGQSKGVYSNIVNKCTKNYLKCLTVSVALKNKVVSCKVFSTGTIQLTGCKDKENVVECVGLLISNLFKVDSVVCKFQSVMMNVTCTINYKIHKYKLCEYLTRIEKIKLPPLLIDSVGLKIRLPYKYPITIPIYKWQDGTLQFQYNEPCNKNTITTISLFQNGKITISGIDHVVVDDAINWIVKITTDAKECFIDEYAEPKTFKR